MYDSSTTPDTDRGETATLPPVTSYEPNRLTGYEVVLVLAGGEARRLGFTPRRSFHGLMAVATRLSPDDWRALGVTEATKTTGNRGRNASLTLEGIGVIQFSGETRFSRYCEGTR